MINIYNTLTRKKEKFVPLQEGTVNMYVCGPTVYNFIHLGNARPLVVFDTVHRFLESRDYRVKYVQNFTDVDDKIILRAKEEGITSKEVAEKYIEEFFLDADALNVKRADIYPKVTENIDEIISFIQQLVAKDLAYAAGGDVYFRSLRYQDYGKLSNQSLDDLIMGARVEVDEKKESLIDFVLWKKAKEGEVFWDSPFGPGRPGWHIECSVMANKFLGKTIDIHAGGADLIFPHHENELAQSESLNQQPFTKYWMHNGYINIDNEKMSKSLGNIFTVKELLQKYHGNVLRFLILSVHYRSPINFSEEVLIHAKNGLERIKNAYANILYRINSLDADQGADELIDKKISDFEQRFIAEMEDDFNTANAISVIFDLIKYTNVYLQRELVSQKALRAIADVLLNWLTILGLENDLGENANKSADAWIEKLIEERAAAKKNKDWQLADKLRDKLSEEGVILEDTPFGTRWRKK